MSELVIRSGGLFDEKIIDMWSTVEYAHVHYWDYMIAHLDSNIVSVRYDLKSTTIEFNSEESKTMFALKWL